MTLVNLNLNVVDGQPVVSSIEVAEHFEKKHNTVLRKIKTLDVPENFTERNFALSEYHDETGRKLPMFNLTRDGFTLVAMGFTGKKAMEWKVRYIEAFNAMEKALLEGKHGEPVALPSTTAERKPLSKLVNTWISVAPISYRDAWNQIHAAVGSDKAKNMTMPEVQQGMAFVQERLDRVAIAAASRPALPAVPDKTVAELEVLSREALVFQIETERTMFRYSGLLREITGPLYKQAPVALGWHERCCVSCDDAISGLHAQHKESIRQIRDGLGGLCAAIRQARSFARLLQLPS